MKQYRPLILRFRDWVSCSIRRKLTVFVVLVCFLMIGLVWLLGVQLLEPAYNAQIKGELARTLDTLAGLLDEAYEDDVPTVAIYQSGNSTLISLSPECYEIINEDIRAGNLQIDSLCLDISDSAGQTLLVNDRLPSRCVLHGTSNLLGGEPGQGNERLAVIRQEVMEGKSVYYATPKQMVMGTSVAGGSIAVVVSTTLESVPEAVGVLQRLMLFVSITLIVIAMFCAFVFSRWFTNPITRLSAAAREMARGNYDVRVKEEGSDEIATLTRDFNEMAREVKRSAALQQDIIANVSHDLRTPLTLIKGYAETIRDLSGDDPAKRNEQLSVIVDETDRLSSLVGSVMELSRMSSGNEKPNAIRFDLAELGEELTYRYDSLCRQSDSHFHYTGPESAEVMGDPKMIERAMHNLLGNALHHVGADGYVGLNVEKTARNTVRVEVIDHGPGIAREDMPHLFDRYYRSRADAGKPGTGLGLSITKAVFEGHGFPYGVISEPGQGAVFWFEAPLAPPPPPSAQMMV